jgi:glycosyltransferase involved in cell wall biosynthesis
LTRSLGPKKIAVFKPYNARHTTAFYGAQHTLFRYMQDRFGMDFTYFVDDPAVSFEGVRTAYVRKSAVGTLFTGAYKLLLSDQVKYPFYWKVGFADFDVVITEGIYYSLLHYVRRCARKVILNDSLSRDPGFSPIRVRYLNRHFSEAHAVVVTERVRSVYTSCGIAIPVTVIGHPVSTTDIEFRKRIAPPRRLVAVGRLVQEKGYDVIIDAVAAVAEAHQDVTLDIFGSGPLEAALTRRIGARRMESRIRLRGQVGREALLRQLSGYDLLISHPLTTRRFAEAFMMANVEAMAAGLPVITSDCGGVPIVVGDNAVVVAERDVQGLRAVLERFVCGEEDMGMWSARGRSFVEENYALDVIAEQWRRIIDAVAARD